MCSSDLTASMEPITSPLVAPATEETEPSPVRGRARRPRIEAQPEAAPAPAAREERPAREERSVPEERPARAETPVRAERPRRNEREDRPRRDHREDRSHREDAEDRGVVGFGSDTPAFLMRAPPRLPPAED